MPLEITETKTGSTTLLQLKGTMVIGKDPEVVTAKVQSLVEAGETQIILDMGEVAYLDSTGISALIRCHISSTRRGAALKLLHLTKRVYDVLQITRLSSVFEIYDDQEKALASFN
jgi:anti-sigma B factor antagonist